MLLRVFGTILTTIVALTSYAQTPATGQFAASDTSKKEESKYVSFFRDDDPMLFNADTEDKSTNTNGKKKKVKKNVYYGLKTRTGFVAKGFGAKRTVETFHYLKEYKEPNKYARYNYYFDIEKQKVQKSTKVLKENNRVLHGPYERSVGNVVIERGNYYIGTKHARWELYGRPHEHTYHKGDSARESIIEYQVLLKKESWYKGWPKSTKLEYYDLDRSKLKEAIPYNEDNQKDGYYVSYFEDGHKKQYGEYALGKKIGKWYTYQKGKKRVIRKSIISYKRRAFDEDIEPVITKEWDKAGHVIIEDGKKVTTKRKPGRKH